VSTAIDRFLAGGAPDTPDVGLAVQHAPPDPERTARVLRASKATGLSGDIVDRQLDQIEASMNNAGQIDTDELSRAAPVTSTWLAEDPKHVTVAKEDISRLSYWERQWRHIKDQFDDGRATTALTGIGTAAMLGTRTAAQEEEQRALETKMGQRVNYGIGQSHHIWQRFGPQGDAIEAALNLRPDYRMAADALGFAETIPGAVANQLPILLQTFKGKAVGAAVGAGAGALVGAATGPGAAATATAGAAAGWRLGGIPAAAQMEGALAYLDYEKIRDDRGMPLDRRVAVGAALLTGAINGALEAFSVEEMAKTIPGIRALGRKGMREMLAKQTTRAAIEHQLKAIGESALSEGTTEFLQEYVTNLSGRIAKLNQDGKPMSVPEFLSATVGDPDFLAGAVQSGVAGAASAIGMGVPGMAHETVKAAKQIRKAEQVGRVFQALGDGASDSKLVERLPEAMQELVGRMTKDGPLENIYIDPQRFTEYFQSKDLDPGDVAAEILGSRAAYDAAMQSGEDLAIPTARYAVTLAPSEHHAGLSQDLTFAPGDMSLRQAKEAAEQLDKEEQSTAAQEAPAEDASAAVGTQVTEQLQAAGFDEPTASAYAKLYQSAFRTLGARVGVDPKELFDRFGLSISRPEVQESQQGAPIDAGAMAAAREEIQAGTARSATSRGASSSSPRTRAVNCVSARACRPR
jgi:hypothetical protein